MTADERRAWINTFKVRHADLLARVEQVKARPDFGSFHVPPGLTTEELRGLLFADAGEDL